MEDIFSLIASGGNNNGIDPTHYPTIFVENWFLYSVAVFVDLLCTIVALVTMYDAVKSWFATRKGTMYNHPINLYKYIVICFSSTLFLRSSMDAAMLLAWGEVSAEAIRQLLDLDRIFDALATIPFLIFAYLVIRGGPVIEFQLLRKPIPTDLHATWSMLKRPILSFLTILVLCVAVTLSK